MDIYPEFYEKCSVYVDKNWKLCNDSLEACSMVSLQYEITWPLNIIISSSQMILYKTIFQFILKLKWVLYTVNHLSFTGKNLCLWSIVYVKIIQKETSSGTVLLTK